MTAGAATAGGDDLTWAGGSPPPPDSLAAAWFLLRLASTGLKAARARGDDGAVRVLRTELDGLLDVLPALLAAERREALNVQLAIGWVRSGHPRAIPGWPADQAPADSP